GRLFFPFRGPGHDGAAGRDPVRLRCAAGLRDVLCPRRLLGGALRCQALAPEAGVSGVTEMAPVISSRTPEGVPNHCPICDSPIAVEPSRPPGDAPCPNCGTLLWFIRTPADVLFYEAEAVAPITERVVAIICESLGVNKEQITWSTPFT